MQSYRHVPSTPAHAGWRFWGLAFVLVVGCSGSKVGPPSFDPGEAADRAFAEFDANKDGYLDAGELERCPALKNALVYLDTDRDKRLSKQELVTRLAYFKDNRTGMIRSPTQFFLNGSYLDGAKVTFVPERFLGDSFKPAMGVTDVRGEPR